MNTAWIEFHLAEAATQIEALRKRVAQNDLDMGEVDLGNSIAEAWGHLNSAWTGRSDHRLEPARIADPPEAEWRRLRARVEDLTPI